MADNKGFNVAGRKVMIAIPCYDGKINVRTAFALATVGPALAAHGAGVRFTELSGCSILPRARNVLVKQFVDSDCTDLLFVDADVIVSPEAIMRLIALSSNKDIVAGTYPTRTESKKLLAGLALDQDSNPIFDENGLLQTTVALTGFMLIRRHVITTLIEAHPEWTYNVDPVPTGRVEHALFDFKLDGNRYVGEDIVFCRRAIAEGFKVWIDPMISLPHVGSHAFVRDFNSEFLQPMMQAQKAMAEQHAINEQEAA